LFTRRTATKAAIAALPTEGTTYLGGEPSDAGGDQLAVQEITSTGFAGVWTYSSGFSVTVDSATGRVVREPSGYFYARRGPRA